MLRLNELICRSGHPVLTDAATRPQSVPTSCQAPVVAHSSPPTHKIRWLAPVYTGLSSAALMPPIRKLLGIRLLLEFVRDLIEEGA
jgi:hypothetical protein